LLNHPRIQRSREHAGAPARAALDVHAARSHG
jgi:hypothetical protein